MFDRRHYAVKEHVGMFKLSDRYDVFDGDTGEKLGLAVEEVGVIKQLLRLVVNKQMLPTRVVVRQGDENGPVVLTLHRGLSFLRSRVDVSDGEGNLLGYFKSKLLSFGGGFYMYDNAGNQAAEVRGDWKSWNFRFLDANQRELGVVSKKWRGMSELFTSADSYSIRLADDVPTSGALAALLLAAGIAIDIVLKEKSD